MRLIFIRHAEPDYPHNCLTEKGTREAKILSRRVSKWQNIRKIYVSPLPRAVLTAQPSLKTLAMEAETLPYLREFHYPVINPTTGELDVPWDFYPEFFNTVPALYDRHAWLETKIIRSNPDLAPAYAELTQGIDGILAENGYHRIPESTASAGTAYLLDEEKTDGDEEDSILFFCHYGVTCFILGHLFGVSPFILAHHTVILPTGVTVINAEKRKGNLAHFRAQFIGDTSHLREAGEPASQHAAFSPVFQG